MANPAKSTATTLAVILMSQLFSCQNQVSDSDNAITALTAESATVETEDKNKTLDLPDIDWEGREFRVLGYENSRTQFSTFEIDSDGENGDIVNDAVFRRNTAIEEKYNVVITEIKDSSNTDYTTATEPLIRKTVLAGDDLYDLVFITAFKSGVMAREQLLYNLLDVDYIDFTKEWWNQDINETLSINDQLYFTTSDFSLRDKNRAYILLYNRTMADELKLGNPIDMVYDGTWTLDVFSQWAIAAGGDLNGDGAIDDGDSFGVTMDSYNAVQAFATGCGIKIVDKNEQGQYEIEVNTEASVDVIETIVNLLNDGRAASTCESWNGKVDYDFWSFAGKAFKEGRALFVNTFPHGLKNFSAECVDDYGIIPYPKYDESQEKYYTYADIMAMLFAIPVTSSDPDFTGFMLEALSAASTDTTLEAYYEVSCKTKYTYDPDSAAMLDITFDGIRYEPAVIYSISGLSDIFTSLGSNMSTAFSSTYASIEKSALSDLEKLIEDFSE